MQHVKFKLFRDARLGELEKELNAFTTDKDVINAKLVATETDINTPSACFINIEYAVLLAYRDLADAENDPRLRR